MPVDNLVELLALASFVALALGTFVLSRRLGRFVNLTRDRELFRRAVTDLDRRIGISLDGVAERIDLVRRRELEADAIGDNLAAAGEAVARYAEEAHALRSPVDGTLIRAGIIEELERAERGLSMVEHGCSIIGSIRRGDHEFESQTAIKRGYLNVRHAREAIARHAADVVTLGEPPPMMGFRRPDDETSGRAGARRR